MKLAGALAFLCLLAFMRKLGSRLARGLPSARLGKTTQFTILGKIFLFSLVVNSVGLLAAPSWKALAVVELVLWTGVLVEAWVHFIAFVRTTNETFAGGVQIVPPREVISVLPSFLLFRPSFLDKTFCIATAKGFKKKFVDSEGHFFD